MGEALIAIIVYKICLLLIQDFKVFNVIVLNNFLNLEPANSVVLKCPNYGFESETIVCNLTVAIEKYNNSKLSVAYGDGSKL